MLTDLFKFYLLTQSNGKLLKSPSESLLMIIIWPSISTLVKPISLNFCKIPALTKAVFYDTIEQLQLGLSIPPPSHTNLSQPVVLEVCNLFTFKEVSTRIGITTWHFGN